MNVPKLPSIDEPTPRDSYQNNLGGHTDRSTKTLYHEDYKSYLRRIKKPYSTFKLNHYSKYSEKVRELSAMKPPSSYYNPATKLSQLGLSKDFFKCPSEFLIDKTLLENKKENLQHIVKGHDKKFEVIEIEMGKILSNSKRMSSYIDDNLCLEISVNKYHRKFQMNKKEISIFKQRILNNSATLMLRGIKRETLMKLLENAKIITKVTDSIKKLKSSLVDCKEESGLLMELKQIINLNKDKLKILSCLEKELVNFEQKNAEKVMEEFEKRVKEVLNGLLMNVKEEKVRR